MAPWFKPKGPVKPFALMDNRLPLKYVFWCYLWVILSPNLLWIVQFRLQPPGFHQYVSTFHKMLWLHFHIKKCPIFWMYPFLNSSLSWHLPGTTLVQQPPLLEGVLMKMSQILENTILWILMMMKRTTLLVAMLGANMEVTEVAQLVAREMCQWIHSPVSTSICHLTLTVMLVANTHLVMMQVALPLVTMLQEVPWIQETQK